MGSKDLRGWIAVALAAAAILATALAWSGLSLIDILGKLQDAQR